MERTDLSWEEDATDWMERGPMRRAEGGAVDIVGGGEHGGRAGLHGEEEAGGESDTVPERGRREPEMDERGGGWPEPAGVYGRGGRRRRGGTQLWLVLLRLRLFLRTRLPSSCKPPTSSARLRPRGGRSLDDTPLPRRDVQKQHNSARYSLDRRYRRARTPTRPHLSPFYALILPFACTPSLPLSLSSTHSFGPVHTLLYHHLLCTDYILQLHPTATTTATTITHAP